jgi:putative oxygen-independent coproporphyrinogen III oxidase
MDKIGLYIHWPYCARICPYCDFNIYKNKEGVGADTEADLVDAMLADMEHWRKMSGSRTLVSIHFGGGTPSLLAPDNIHKFIEKAKNLWTPTDNLEIGLEANPKDISTQSLSAWNAAGIERLSIGVQSFDDKALQFLGRDHDGEMAERALELAVDIMPRVSVDLIYGLVGGRPDVLYEDLQIAIQRGVTHISAYQLTVEQKTAFGQAEKRGVQKAVDSDASADFFEQVISVLSSSGFAQYEVSNFAKGQDVRSRHNYLYWQGGDYVGVGPGAHGRITTGGQRSATIATLKPQNYIARVTECGHGISEQETLSPKGWAEEYVLMGMRINEGISLSRYKNISGHSLAPEKVKQYVDAGLLALQGDRLVATPKGRLVLDALCHELLI